MADSFTSDKVLALLMGAGENENTWGGRLNDEGLAYLAKGIAGYEAIDCAGSADVTLTAAQAKNALLKLTGVLTADIDVIVPTAEGGYRVWNATTGAFTVTVKTSAGTGIVIPQGATYEVWCDGTNVIEIFGLTFKSTDVGADVGPVLTLHRDSASPAASDVLGGINFDGEDAAGNQTSYASIRAFVSDTTNGSEDGALGIFTMEAGTLTQQVTVTSVGDVGIGQGSPGGKLEVENADTSKTALLVDQNVDAVAASLTNAGGTTSVVLATAENGGYANTNGIFRSLAVRGASSAYSFFTGDSGNGADREFLLGGDGNGQCDGAWTGGGADYAEYFEALTGAKIAPGTSVVLDGAKVRAATGADDPADIIGVIRPYGVSAVVGNAGALKWVGKYERDDFGAYKLDGKGERRLSKGFDPKQEYVPREKRPEWVIVGLMGQIGVLKGQPVGDRWRKMRDVSAGVEMWLVR
jgi:hypothetical protein